ncbi:MAG TPA: hypothetical protein VNX68_03970, partial [Nitrosopumilaceae archaeon]|nr:hypothetical protein [Nitrosopumilaceae archaeon]
KKIPALDGNLHLPRKVLFITPYNIDARSLQSRFEKYQELKNDRVTILDGTKIAELLISRCPNIARDLLGHEATIETTTLTNLSNDTLMRALQVNNSRKIEDFYCDLDFALGRQSNHLLSANLKDKQPDSEKIHPERLSVLWEIHKAIYDSTKINLVADTSHALSAQRSIYENELEAEADGHLIAVAKQKYTLSEQIFPEDRDKITHIPWNIIFPKAWIEYELQERKIRTELEKTQRKGAVYFCLFFRLMSRLKSNRKNFRYTGRAERSFKKVDRTNDLHQLFKQTEIRELYAAASVIFRLIYFYQDYLKKNDSFHYDVKLNLGAISNWIMEKRGWLANEVQNINLQKTNKSHLTNFLKEANQILVVCDKLFTCSELA